MKTIKMKPLRLMFFILLLFSEVTFAGEYSQSFSAASMVESGDLIWNRHDAKVYPPIYVDNYNDGSVKDKSLDVGSGKHGVFDSSTYANFSVGGDVSGNIIRIDTDEYPVLQFTSFHLVSGWTIRPQGSQPLIIKSQSTVLIEGSIDCSGESGGSLNADNTVVSAGGLGHCGGGAGGRGGSTLLAPTNGDDGGLNTTGGSAGPNLSLTKGQGGGGGGSYTVTGLSRDPTNGDDSLGGTGGTKGTIFRNDNFSILAGGSGGGGGSVFHNGVDANNSSGGGGGAGGGAIFISALGDITVSATGLISANGGAGGGDTGTKRGGGGGGGGGGSIAIFTPGNIIFNGPVTATKGAAGVTLAANGGDGGEGGSGRTWITDTNGVASGGVVESPISLLLAFGSVAYKIGNNELISSSIDIGNTAAQIIGSIESTSLSGAGSVDVQVAIGDQSDFVAATWEDPTAVTQAPGRYLRFKVIINNQVATNPSTLNNLVIQYNGNIQEDFDFIGGCGYVKSMGPPARGSLYVLFILLIIPILYSLVLKKLSYQL